MKTAESYNHKRVILKDLVHSHLNGKRTMLSHAQLNDNGDIIACTNIPHPEFGGTFLWVNVNSEVECFLEYDSYFYQYRHKITLETLNLPFDVEVDNRNDYDIIGMFDVYNKMPIILT